MGLWQRVQKSARQKKGRGLRAAAGCAQGIEFVLKDERKFPDEYPSKGAEITVSGIFDIYKEGAYQYCQLIDAVTE